MCCCSCRRTRRSAIFAGRAKLRGRADQRAVGGAEFRVAQSADVAAAAARLSRRRWSRCSRGSAGGRSSCCCGWCRCLRSIRRCCSCARSPITATIPDNGDFTNSRVYEGQVARARSVLSVQRAEPRAASHVPGDPLAPAARGAWRDDAVPALPRERGDLRRVFPARDGGERAADGAGGACRAVECVLRKDVRDAEPDEIRQSTGREVGRTAEMAAAAGRRGVVVIRPLSELQRSGSRQRVEALAEVERHRARFAGADRAAVDLHDRDRLRRRCR